ncbi:hypothetical protein ACYVMD_004593 [Vibrio parahaemolyticus]|nr:hypothetical protein [Vibrio parahaemolyticus]EJC7066888.1 hypothetical protein [Vibrio parahaemolyticus]
MNGNNQLTAIHTTEQHSPAVIAHHQKTDIYKNLRQTTAIASAMEALATKALEEGETGPIIIEQLADISSKLASELSRASGIMAELLNTDA